LILVIVCSLISGGAAGTVASCITNPLEVIKTRLQASASSTATTIPARLGPLYIARQIMRADGIPGFFRGLPPTLVGIIPSRSAYFYAYSRCKSFLDAKCGLSSGSPPNALISGFVAGVVGNTITNPIWMIRTRMQLEADAAVGQVAYKGYLDVIGTIFRQDGIKGFYRGLQASYWGCTEGALQFILYEQLKRQLLQRENRRRLSVHQPETTELSHAMYFWSAALAKMIASIATYPHEVARTRLREQSRMGLYKYTGMWQTIRTVAQEEGRSGLYAGMGVHLMKVVPNSALMFLTYEIVRGWLSGFTIVGDDGIVTASV
jgi:solute carrier family 25, member 33/36